MSFISVRDMIFLYPALAFSKFADDFQRRSV